MNANEVRKLSSEEIDIEVQRLRRKLFDLRCQMVTEKIENTAQFRKLKKAVARLLTERTVRMKKAEAVS